jgi:signal peptidase I
MSVTTPKARETSGGLWETVKIIIQALLLALVVRTFLFQPFSIPSGSMEDTLLIGDYLLVSKYAYGYSHFSFPLSPDFFEGRVFGREPERGDVVVFKLPRDTKVDYIKRVIGLPGDRIQMRGGVLYINEVPVERERLPDVVRQEPFGGTTTIVRWRETLPNGVSYETLDLTPNGMSDNTSVYEVPEGHFFAMGDNRDNSTDSRFQSATTGVGYVPFENLVGRAEIIFFSVDESASAWQFWRWPWTVRFDRLFNRL